MDTFKSFERQLYTVNDDSFQEIALELFRFQAERNPVYKSYLGYLGLDPMEIASLPDIPFLPISFFKHHDIKTGAWQAEAVFESSGTTGSVISKHQIQNLKFYLDHSERCFNHFFGDLSQYHFLALLPSYLERQNSSLVAMMDHFIKKSASPFSGFYLHDIGKLLRDIEKLKKGSRKIILWGVTFALLDLAEKQRPDLGHCLVFETGGMKGKRKEITRHELHAILTNGLNLETVYSEYGMTELLSQAYSAQDNVFRTTPWLKILGREITDPLRKGLLDETAGINVVDLANWHSVSFIETEDLGKVYADGSFEVLGRMDNSDVRGCNLLVE